MAIKIIDKSRLEPADHKKLEREIAVMKSLVHPYIIRLYEVKLVAVARRRRSSFAYANIVCLSGNGIEEFDLFSH